MGAIKKYHFLLYVSEEQELAIRQLFLLNRWEIHCKGLPQLVDILKGVENESQERPADGPNQQQRHHQLLTAQKDSEHLPTPCSSSDIPGGERSTHDLAAQELSRSIREIEKEAEQSEKRPASDEATGTVPPIQGKQPVQNGSSSSSISGRNFNISPIETTAEDPSLKEVQKTNPDVTVEGNNSSLAISACISNLNRVGIATHSDQYSEMDTLAKASEIAGIPYQQPDGTLHFMADSLEYNRIEHVYQLPSHTYQPQTVQNSMQSGVQIHNKGIEQILRASAIVPPQDFEHYSQNSEISKMYHTSSILSPLQTQENQTKASDITVKPSDAVFSTKPDEKNVHNHEQHQTGVSEHLSVNTVQDTIKSSNQVNNQKNVAEVSEASIAINEKECSSIGDKTANNSPINTGSGIVTDRSTNLENQFPADLQKKASNDVGKCSSEKEKSGCTSNKDYLELKINGSIVKIPVFKPREKENTDKIYVDSGDEKETGKFPEKDNLEEMMETSRKGLSDKADLDPEQAHKENTKEKEISEKLMEISERLKVSAEQMITCQDNKTKQKRRQALSEFDMVVNKKLKSRNPSKAKNVSKENEKIIKFKNKEETSKCASTESKEEKLKNTTVEEHIGMMSKVAKTYPTRLKAKKEMLANVKMKRKDKGSKSSKKSNSEQVKHTKPSKSNNKKKNEISKDSNNLETRENDKEKENKIKSNFKNSTGGLEPAGSKLVTSNKKYKTNKAEVETPSRKRKVKTELVCDTDQLEGTEIKLENVVIKTENQEAETELSYEKPQKLKKKLKKLTVTEEESDYEDKIIFPSIYSKCSKCGKNSSKEGYCKVCMVKCPWCSVLLSKSDRKLYRTHVRNHRQSDNPKPFQCSECEMKFTSQIFLNRHMKNKHVGEDIGPIICEICEKRFTTKYSLKGHINHMHGDRKRDVQCDLCGNFFLSQGYLRQHRQYVHQEERNFTCELCHISVKTETLLKRHMARHTDEKNEVCQICGSSFRVRSDLLRHMVRHDSSRRTFKCEHCGKGFFEDQKLKQHLRIHTGDKPFKCHLCTYKCAVKGNLTKHFKTHSKRDDYLGRAYRKKGSGAKVITEHIADEGMPVQMQIEVITTDEHNEQGIPQYGVDVHDQGLVQYETAHHETQQYEVCKREIPHYDAAKQEMLRYDLSKQEVAHLGTDKLDIPHFDRQEMPRFEVPYEATSEELEHETDQFEPVRTEPIRTEPDPVRIYYEAVPPSHIEAGRTYLEQPELKEYKESAEGEHYLNQLNMTMIANNYKNTNVSKIDFYNI